MRRVLAAEGLVLPGPPAREPAARTPWPDWLEWKPNRVWAYDFTHFTRASGSRSRCSTWSPASGWPPLVSAEETSTQVEVCFLAALDAEDLLADIDARHTARCVEALPPGDRDRSRTSIDDGRCRCCSR